MIRIILTVATKESGITLLVLILPAEFKHLLVKVFHLRRQFTTLTTRRLF